LKTAFRCAKKSRPQRPGRRASLARQGARRNRRRGRSPVHAPGYPGRRPAGQDDPQDRPQFRHPAVAAERDGTPSGRRRRAAPRENGGIRKVVREEAVTVDACGADLPGIDPVGRERRVQAGIVFEIVGSSVEAWTKERPGCGSRTIVSLRIGNDVNPLV